jgi:hypothetical protein
MNTEGFLRIRLNLTKCYDLMASAFVQPNIAQLARDSPNERPEWGEEAMPALKL